MNCKKCDNPLCDTDRKCISPPRYKPCPFCGGEARLTEHDCANSSDMWGKVECHDCGVYVKESACLHRMKRDNTPNAHKDLAVSSWNTRA